MVEDTLFEELCNLNTKPNRIKKPCLLSNVDTVLYKEISNMTQSLQVACIIDKCVLENIIDFLTLRKQLHVQQLLGNYITLLIDNLINDPEEVEGISKHLQKLTDAKVVLLNKKMKSLNTYVIFSGLDCLNLYTLVELQKENRKDSGHTLDFIFKKGLGITTWQHTPTDLLLSFENNDSYVSNHEASTVKIQPNYITTNLKASSVECLNTASILFEAIARVPDSSFLELCSRILIIDDNLRYRLAQIFSKAPLKTKQEIARIVVVLTFPDKKIEVSPTTQKYIHIPLDGYTNAYELLASANVCSRSELRRLFSSNAVRKTSPAAQILTPDYSKLEEGDIVRIGKRFHIKVGVA